MNPQKENKNKRLKLEKIEKSFMIYVSMRNSQLRIPK